MNSDNLYIRIVHFIDGFMKKGSVNKKEIVYLQNLTKIVLTFKKKIMARSYTKEEIIQMCKDASKDMSQFYKADVINYRGKTKDGILYTEIVAEWLLENINKFSEIKVINRENSYRIQSHDGTIQRLTNRIEEITAKRLFHKCFDFIGIIVDYQTPLKDKQTDNAGKIDLLSVNKDEKSVYILELKKEDSKETMLRCVLEAYTYLQTVNKEKLLSDFYIDKEYKVKASPLVYKDAPQYLEFKENRRYLKTLMEKLDSVPFFIEEITSYKISK